jgi:hypothetical protein
MKVLIMIYILIGFVIDVVLVIGLIYLNEGKVALDKITKDFKKKHLNLILALFFIEMLFIWPYVMFIYKPKSDMEVSDE